MRTAEAFNMFTLKGSVSDESYVPVGSKMKSESWALHYTRPFFLFRTQLFMLNGPNDFLDEFPSSKSLLDDTIDMNFLWTNLSVSVYPPQRHSQITRSGPSNEKYDLRRLAPQLQPLAFLIGKWRSEHGGKAIFPTIPKFTYGEEVDISIPDDALQAAKALNYTYAHSVDSFTPNLRSTGLIREWTLLDKNTLQARLNMETLTHGMQEHTFIRYHKIAP
ncbi:hypothetical protein TELCIR_03462 [Teladorsagia circumcincta]|uniref:THAP4-like heme-binding domain-containing protein n=1 Tax=Teladorsagia circumcincta TaxID=45464 RepID=A0A2G9UWB0_TELCI|nr:hypothetical protein TELCIR_03462 [Teladorsagia circumcincta]